MKTVHILIMITLAIIGIVIFNYKTYLDFELACEVKNGTEFYPDAYTFIHSEKDLKRYNFTGNEAKLVTSTCNKMFDFRNFSYLIIYGRKPKAMYYSLKSKYMDDKSASYVELPDSKVVFIEYVNEQASSDGKTYVYKLQKQVELRGFFGI